MPTINQLIAQGRKAPRSRNKGVKDRRQRRSKYGAKRPK